MSWVKNELEKMNEKYSDKKKELAALDDVINRTESKINYARERLSRGELEPSMRVALAEDLNRLNSEKVTNEKALRRLGVELFKISHNLELLDSRKNNENEYTESEVKRMYM